LAGLILVILFVPIFLSFSSNGKKEEDTSIMIYIFHPAVLRISYIIRENIYEIAVLNIFIFGTLKEKSRPDITEIIEKPDIEQSMSEPIYSEAEHDFEEFISEEKESEEDSNENIQPELDIEDQNDKDYQEDIDIKKDKNSTDSTSLIGVSFKNLKNKIYVFKEFSKFILYQKKIAGKIVFWLLRIIKAIFRVVSFDDLSLYLKAGFDDPYITGIIYGYFTGIKNFLELNNKPFDSFQFEPVFNKNDSITIGAAIRIKTSLVRMCWPLLVAIFTFPYISGFILWRRIKKREKTISKRLI
jgi:hypothetical protein